MLMPLFTYLLVIEKFMGIWYQYSNKIKTFKNRLIARDK